jgi:urea transport system ATP-binding protein
MLSITKINQFYGQSHTLWDMTIDIEKGACTVLMGRNGVGKTTLLQCIMGLLPIRSGTILFGEVELTKQIAELRSRSGIGYVPQGRQIFPLLTVEENLRIGLNAARGKTKEVPELVYQLFPVLKEMLGRRGGDLSGGQQQQLAIGRALVLNPEFLILDEPTEGIQPNIVQEIGQIIRRLNKEFGLTVLIVEQKLPFARLVGDNFFIIDRGRCVEQGKINRLTDQMVKEYLTV